MIDMSIFFLKSILSFLMLFLTIFLMFTMFEILGRSQKRFDLDKLKKLHKISGFIYMAIFLTITYFCLHFIVSAKTELSSRASLHSLLAVTIIVLFVIKLSFIRAYRQYYGQVKNIGLVIAVLTFGLVSLSGGYYLLVSEFGTNKSFDMLVQNKEGIAIEKDKNKNIQEILIKTDAESIGRGKNLFESKCSFCHDAFSTETKVGPGLKGLLKNRRLPVSKYPAVPANIIKQLRQPFDRMPSFDYLTDDETADILAFLNTL